MVSTCSLAACEELVRRLRDSAKFSKLIESNKGPGIKITCRPCTREGPEGGARAVLLDSTPLEVALCTNRLGEKDIEEVLVHELVHVYDHTNQRCNLMTCEGLAFSEVRAAREAECNRFFPCQWLKTQCIKYNATRATANLFPEDAAKCVESVLRKAIADKAPFE